jgi:CO/xanthine dehydrogenase FAD-binding subunit
MVDVEYYKPASMAEALEVLYNCIRHGDKVSILAGGTDLVPFMKSKCVQPDVIVEITDLADIRGISVADSTMTIGAATPYMDIVENSDVKELVPCLYHACRQVGSVQIRTRGTIGGNLCTASPAGDSLPPLFVLEATLHISSMNSNAPKQRAIPVDEFFTGPNQTVLKPGELLTSISFPVPSKESKSFFMKLGQRRAMTISKVNIAALATLTGGKIQDIRIAMGSVDPTVIRARKTEQYLKGKDIKNSAVLEEATARIQAECSPIDDIRSLSWYRKEMTSVLLTRALQSFITPKP